MPTSAQEELELRQASAAIAEIKQRHFPTFTAAPRAVAYLASSDPGLLATTAVLLVLTTLFAAFSRWFFSFGQVLRFGSWSELELWTVSCLALLGCWSTLGSGRWHVRFSGAVLAALWLVAILLYSHDSILFLNGHSTDRIVPQAIAAFVLGAFSAAWIRSIGRIELARPAAASSPRLRSGQFSLSGVLSITFVVATVLGLLRAPENLWSSLAAVPRHLAMDVDSSHPALLSTLGVLAALLVAFRSPRTILGVFGGSVLALLVAELARKGLLTNRQTASWLYGLLWHQLATAMISLALASVVLFWLRLWGFRWVRVGPTG